MAQRQRRVQTQVHKTLLDRLADGFADPIEALIQPVFNCLDWEATQITIRFVDNPDGTQDIEIHDNGAGLNARRRESYTVLGDSEARNKRGAHGRNGTGRIAFLPHAEFCKVQTRAADEDAFEIELSRDAMYNAWFVGNPPLAWRKVTRRGLVDALPQTGTVVIWRRIGCGEGVNPNKVRTPVRVANDLGRFLSPHETPLVRVVVVDLTGNEVELPLRTRVVKGKPINGSDTDLPEIGSASYELFVVESPDREYDGVRMFGKGSHGNWSALADMLRRDPRYVRLVRVVDNVMSHPLVTGRISYPFLNAFATSDRRGLVADLLEYEAGVFAMLTHLRSVVVPQVEAVLGMRSAEIFTTSDETLLGDVTKLFQSVSGVVPPGKTVVELALNRHRVDIEPSMTVDLEIQNPDPQGRYCWECDDSTVAQLSAATGDKVTLRGVKIGQTTVTVGKMGVVGTPPQCTVKVKVVERLPLRFGRPTISMSTNDRRRVTLQNTHNTSGDLDWQHDDFGGELHVSEDMESAEIISGDREGQFDLRVEDRENRRLRAVCTLHIEKDAEERPKARNSSQSEFNWEGHVFQLRGTTQRDQAGSTSWIEIGREASVITLNFGHPIFDSLQGTARMALVVREACLRVAQQRLPDGKPRDFMQIAGAISARLTQVGN